MLVYETKPNQALQIEKKKKEHHKSKVSMAATAYAAVLTPRVPSTTTVKVKSSHCFALPCLPPRSSTSPFSSSIKQVSESRRFPLLQVRASSSEETSTVDADELFSDLKEKWDAIENKSTVLLYGGGAIVAVWLSSTIVGAINSVPLLPKLLELIGLGYTGWFVYRYLLFKSSRKELATDIEALKKKIAGTE